MIEEIKNEDDSNRVLTPKNYKKKNSNKQILSRLNNTSNEDAVNNEKKEDTKDINDNEHRVILSLNNVEQNISSLKKTLNSFECADGNMNNHSVNGLSSPGHDKQLSENKQLIEKTSEPKENGNAENEQKQNDDDDCITINEEEEENIPQPQIKINQIKMSLNEFVTKASQTQPAMCFLCDKYVLPNGMFKTDGCQHFFCQKCGKLYFEDRIEQGVKVLKCPLYKCKILIPIESIKKLVSPQHFKGLTCNRNEDNIYKYEFYEDIALQKKFQEKIENVKTYSNRHVLDINTNEAFYMFNQAKDQFCLNCQENALFSKNGNHFIKCLNCFHTVCKYCFTRYDALHMDISMADHCKVYYRRKEKNFLDTGKCKFGLIQFLLVVASFFIMFGSSFNYIYQFFLCLFCIRKRSKPLCVLIIVYFFSIIFFVATIPLILMSFPYFSIIIEVFG